MITCPQCKNSLPDWAQSCQFCGSPLTNVPRPKVEKERRTNLGAIPKWIWALYYTVCIYWLVEGTFDILTSFHVIQFGSEKVEAVDPFGIIAGGISVICGLGLIIRLEFIRGIVNFVCFLNILSGLLGGWAGLMLMAVNGMYGSIILILNALQVITSALMIWLIGETDRASY
ncbi:MAG: hypothetical protein KF784_03080 [Fimbriimonadaceae bacterium]|nr:hypothetical protein [Fimbriimonadaceae bacterium]